MCTCVCVCVLVMLEQKHYRGSTDDPAAKKTGIIGCKLALLNKVPCGAAEGKKSVPLQLLSSSLSGFREKV